MPRPIRIDFVSDISCPWCIIGLRGLEIALERLGDAVEADIHFQPFELNPAMAPEGENIVEHIGRKYGATPEQSAANRANIRERAASVGFTMTMTDTSRIYNSFDAPGIQNPPAGHTYAMTLVFRGEIVCGTAAGCGPDIGPRALKEWVVNIQKSF